MKPVRSCFLSFGASLFAAGVSATELEPLQPRVDAGAKVGTVRSLGTMEGWWPLYQDERSVMYGDIRWMSDDQDNSEGNLGIGYRTMEGDHIIGAHGWFDQRTTDRGSRFYQLTAGVEYLKADWDIKANAYIPLNKHKFYATPNIGSSTPYLAGNGLFVDTAGQIIEEAQPGLDVEFGYRLPLWENDLDAVRVYAGGYGFQGTLTDNVVGGRVRASVDVDPLINVGTRMQYDNPRGSQAFLEATFRFPIEAKKRFQREGLRARMDESPERDIDIVTGAAVDNGLRKQVINTTSGEAQRVIHVDNSAAPGGDGSKENPYNTLAAAQSVLAANDVVYVHRGDGTTTGQNRGITIDKSNVLLIGSGADFVYDAGRYTVNRPGGNGTNGSLIVAASAAPSITNTEVGADSSIGNGVYVIADNTTVSGLSISGTTRHGIYVGVRGSVLPGAAFESATITNNTVSNNALYGILVQASGDVSLKNVLIDNNTTNANQTRSGVGVLVETNSRVENVMISNNQSNNNLTTSGHGFLVQPSFVGGVVENLTFSGNTATGNGGNGIYVNGNTDSRITRVVADNNILTSNASAGFQARAATGAIISDVTISNSSTINGNNVGVYFYANGGTITKATASKVTVTNSTTQGVYGQAIANSTIGTLNLTEVIANTNNRGVYIHANGGTIGAANFTDVTANSNNTQGIYLHALANSAINNATIVRAIANSNTTRGLHAHAVAATSVVNNVAVSSSDFRNNTTNGVHLQKADAAATFNVDLGGGSLGSIGQNRIFGNTGNDLNIDRAVAVSARNNWWNNAPANVNTAPTRVTLTNGASVVSTPVLLTDPRP